MTVAWWGKVAGTVLGLAVLGGSLSPASPAEAAGDVRSDVVLCKPTAFIAMLAPAGSSVAVSGQSLSKKGVRRSGGQIRATMSATGTVTTTATYEAEGEVTRCDGSGPAKETLTVKVTANASSAVAAKASVKGRSKKAAYRAAKKAVRAKLRDKGVDANAPVIKANARADATELLLAKAGGPTVGPSLPSAEALKYLEDRMFDLINVQRSQNMGTWNGQPVALSPWKRLPEIEPAGRAWAQHLIDNNLPLAHPSSAEIKADGDALGCNQRPGGFPNAFSEALATTRYPQDMEAVAQETVQAWMASPSHRAILLSYADTYAGVASAFAVDGGGVVALRTAAADCSNITGY